MLKDVAENKSGEWKKVFSGTRVLSTLAVSEVLL